MQSEISKNNARSKTDDKHLHSTFDDQLSPCRALGNNFVVLVVLIV